MADMERTDLQRLSKDELINLVVLRRPDKTSHTRRRTRRRLIRRKSTRTRVLAGRNPGVSRTIGG
jgi:uncharacterized hydantoinase/oxoprolinase family protein